MDFIIFSWCQHGQLGPEVFAPSNTAMQLLGPGVLETLRSGRNQQLYLELLQ